MNKRQEGLNPPWMLIAQRDPQPNKKGLRPFHFGVLKTNHQTGSMEFTGWTNRTLKEINQNQPFYKHG